MSKKEKVKSPWGPITVGKGWRKEDQEDEIDKLINQQAEIKKELLPMDVPIKEWEANKAQRMSTIESKIWHLIHLEAQKKIYKETS